MAGPSPGHCSVRLRGSTAGSGKPSAIASSIARWQAADVYDQVELWSQSLGQIQRAAAWTWRSGPTSRCWRRPPCPTAAPPAASTAHVGLGAVAYQRGEFDTALPHLTEGLVAVPPVRQSRLAGQRLGYPGLDPPRPRR